MNNIYLSKSRYCKARQCKKIIWLKKYKPEYAIQKARDIVLENGKTGQEQFDDNLFKLKLQVETIEKEETENKENTG